MPRVLPRRKKWAKNQLLIAWISGTGATPEGQVDVIAGTRVRGDSAVARYFPGWFVEADTPDDELPNMWDSIPAPTQPLDSDRGAIVAPPIPNEDARVCHTRFIVLATGRTVGEGAVFHKDDELVRAYPEFFASAPVAA